MLLEAPVSFQVDGGAESIRFSMDLGDLGDPAFRGGREMSVSEDAAVALASGERRESRLLPAELDAKRPCLNLAESAVGGVAPPLYAVLVGFFEDILRRDCPTLRASIKMSANPSPWHIDWCSALGCSGFSHAGRGLRSRYLNMRTKANECVRSKTTLVQRLRMLSHHIPVWQP